ncbi:MAG: Uma2 family endonuclease [Synechococcales bacterium]|nr:Uma2 family endonuclease [Synechococcales bacterium]
MLALLNPTPDQQIFQSGLTWADFKLIQKGLERSSGLRLSYFEGQLEILMPGKEHEQFVSIIGYLIMTFLTEQGIFFQPTRSMTQEKEGLVSTQADESYCIGTPKALPDLAIEVVFTSGSLQKLLRYRALEIPEVWFWEDGLLRVYHLMGDEYLQCDRSRLPGLANLDLEQFSRYVLMAETDAGAAFRAFRQMLLDS